MEFYKMQGAGNDFIIINNMNLKIPIDKLSYIAKKLCKRKLSIGADGLMVVDYPDGDSDFKMRFYNQDGSIGEMCGNGARCIARYAYVNHIAGKHMTFETTAGIVEAEILEGRLVKVLLNYPEVILLDQSLDIEGRIYQGSYVELGNPGLPHLVVEHNITADLDDLRKLGERLRYYPTLHKGANVNFYTIVDEHTAMVKTYERGVEDFTLACGTGSASTAVCLLLKEQLKGNKVRIIVDGGELFIDWNRDDKLYLIGDTNIVARGIIMDEALKL